MAIASLSFSVALPTYNSIGGNGTFFAQNSIAAKGDIAVDTNGAPASSGKATVLTSDLTADGLSYTPQGALISGNQLTVYYNLTGNNDASSATDSTAQQTLQAGDQGVALASGLYGTGITITPEGSQTNGDITTTAYDISLNGPVNGVIGSINQQTGYSVSNSSDGSSLSLNSISSLGDGLKVTFQLSDAPPATTAPQPASPPATVGDTGNDTLPASLKGVTTIGDLLANASGLSFSGTLTGALQARSDGQSTGTPDSGSILASVLNPSINLSPSTPLQISDFINTGSGAGAASAPPTPSSASGNSFDTQGTNDFLNSQNSPAPTQGNAPVGVYTVFADIGASTIRGGNLNVVA